MNAIVDGGWLTVNRACNLRCPWCYGVAAKFDTKSTMSAELARDLLGLMKDVGVKNVVILGGEPTIYPHFDEVLVYAIERGLNPIVVTNGLCLADVGFARHLKSLGLRDLTVSVKTTDPEEYDKLDPSGGRGLLDRVCCAVQNAKVAGLGPNISVTLVKSFLSRLNQLVDLLIKLDPASVTIDMGSPVLTETSVEAAGIPNPFELRDAVRVLHQMLKGTKLRYSFNISIPLCLIDDDTRGDMIRSGKILTTCHVPKGKGVVFDPEGEVVLCNHFAAFPIGKFGVDFRTPEEFAVFWRSEDLAEVRGRATLYPHERCRTCPDWDICGGGCFVKWLYWDPQSYLVERR